MTSPYSPQVSQCHPILGNAQASRRSGFTPDMLTARIGDKPRPTKTAPRHRSPADQFLQVFRVALAVQRDLVRGGGDFPQVVRREFDRDGAEIFLEPVELRGAG